MLESESDYYDLKVDRNHLHLACSIFLMLICWLDVMVTRLITYSLNTHEFRDTRNNLQSGIQCFNLQKTEGEVK